MLTAGEDGVVDFTGFYGDYDVTVNGETYRISLEKDVADYQLVVELAGDFDGDGTVNAADLAQWQQGFDEGSALGDADGDLDTDGADVHWEMIRAIWSSIADSAVVPLQDILGLDNSAIMNRPSTTSGNWQWRFKEGDLTEEISGRLSEMTQVYGRVRSE